MPYGRRFDWPGALHHVMSRGVNGMGIFRTTYYKRMFMDCMGKCFPEAGLKVHAWAVMNNHFHLLAETGEVPLSAVMQKLLTRWAMKYNYQEQRNGRVFQGRYRSILVDRENYFFTLVAYINMNPLRSGYVKSLDDLCAYPFCSYSLYDESRPCFPWECPTRQSNVSLYREALAKLKSNIADDSLKKHLLQPCSAVGSQGISPLSENSPGAFSEEKILVNGGEAYVLSIIRHETDRRLQPIRCRLHQHDSAEKALEKVCMMYSVTETALRGASRKRKLVLARRLLIHTLVDFCGFSLSDAGRFLGRSRQAVAYQLEKPVDQRILKEMQCK